MYCVFETKGTSKPASFISWIDIQQKRNNDSKLHVTTKLSDKRVDFNF